MTPICAKCDKPVDWWRIEELPAFMTYRYIVGCHNEIDTCELSRDEIPKESEVVAVIAFTKELLK